MIWVRVFYVKWVMYFFSLIIWLIYYIDLDVWDDILVVRVRMFFIWLLKKFGICRVNV